MALILKKKPQPLTFGTKVRLASRKVGKTEKPKFKKRPVEVVDDRRQSEMWSLAINGGGQRHGLSVSAIEKFLTCREQFRLERAQGWRSRKGSEAIDFGEWWHWLLGRMYSAKAAKSQDLMTAIKVYRAQWHRDNPNVHESRVEALEVGFLKTAALWPTYLAKYRDDDAKKNYVGVEHEWSFKYSLPPWMHGDAKLTEGCIVEMRGIFDGLFRLDGRLWLLETKTKGRIDEAEIEDTLHLDVQVMTYLYAVKRCFKEYPAGVCYNVIRNPSTNPAKKQGGESHDAFVKRLTKEVEKDEDHYFKRWSMEVKPEEIDLYEETQLMPILREIQGWAFGFLPHFINTKALAGKYGKCDMYDAITKRDFTGLDRLDLTKIKER